MDGTLCSFVHGERLLALWATTVTQEEPTRLQHVVPAHHPLMEIAATRRDC